MDLALLILQPLVAVVVVPAEQLNLDMVVDLVVVRAIGMVEDLEEQEFLLQFFKDMQVVQLLLQEFHILVLVVEVQVVLVAMVTTQHLILVMVD